MTKSQTDAALRREADAKVHYVATIPRKLPAGEVLVHNHVRPRKRLGMGGFRAWTQEPDDRLEPCGCNMAGAEMHGHAHYRIKRSILAERGPQAETTMAKKAKTKKAETNSKTRSKAAIDAELVGITQEFAGNIDSFVAGMRVFGRSEDEIRRVLVAACDAAVADSARGWLWRLLSQSPKRRARRKPAAARARTTAH